MISAATSTDGNNGVLYHDPTAIFASNVMSPIECCKWLTVKRPPEKARSASTEDAENIGNLWLVYAFRGKFHCENGLTRSTKNTQSKFCYLWSAALLLIPVCKKSRLT